MNAKTKTATKAATAKGKKAAKVVADPHALTPAAKERKAKSAQANARNPKASNQTAVPTLSANEKRGIAEEAQSRKRTKKVLGVEDLGGEAPRKTKARLNRELEAEAKAEGTVRAYDAILSVGAAPNTDSYVLVKSESDQTLVPKHRFAGEVQTLAVVGGSYRAFKEAWKTAQKTAGGKLANGLDGRNAPHSSKAVADRAHGKAPASNKADKRAAVAKAQTEKKAARKAERAAKAAPKADDTRKITLVDKKYSYGKPGSARNASWLACTKAKTVADYAKAGGALKYLSRWVSAGAIKLG